jgi:hypothetical protein
LAAPPPVDAWHLLETHFVVATTREGKRYKDWLFARGDGEDSKILHQAIEGGATLIMRDVVREYLRREYSPPFVVSLNMPVSREEVHFTLEDLLPAQADPACEVEIRELGRLARSHAKMFLAEMTRRERVALLGRHLGLSVAHRALEQAAACGKSALSAALREFVLHVAGRLRSEYPDDDACCIRVLLGMVIERVRDYVVEWALNTENGCSHLFALAAKPIGAESVNLASFVRPLAAAERLAGYGGQAYP